MWPFSKSDRYARYEREAEQPLGLERLNQLETRVRNLELESGERHIAVMRTIEKVLYQLKARESKRARSETASHDVELDERAAGPQLDPVDYAPGDPRARRRADPQQGSAHLARRFKGGG